jgi:stress-induced-phosphoprotein 1
MVRHRLQHTDFLYSDKFTQAIALDSNNHVLYSNRSAVYAAQAEYEKALADAEKAIEIKPDWSKGHQRKGAAYRGLGDLRMSLSS